MPLSLLLVEGEDQSADARLVREVLRGLPLTVRPSGGKDGFPNLVQNLRRVGDTTAGLCDGDFPRAPASWEPSDDAEEWSYNRQGAPVRLGWRWRRKEIESYLLDPDVLQRTWGWSPAQRAAYVAHLEAVLDKLGPATAARVALTVCVSRRERLETRVDVHMSEVALEQLLRQRAAQYNEAATLDEQRLLQTYRDTLPACAPGGRFRAAGLRFFAGKDICALLCQRAGVRQLHPSLGDVRDLADDVIDAMGRDPAPHTWLPEWAALRAAVEAWSP